MRIIVVHSDMETSRLLSSLVPETDAAAELSIFHNGKQALAHAMGHRVDVAFLGMELPGLRGLQLAQRLKAFNPLVNLVVLLDDADEEKNTRCAGRAFKLRASGALYPPYTAQAVERELASLRFSVRRASRKPGRRRAWRGNEQGGPADGTGGIGASA